MILVNCAHRTIHNTLYTIAHLERLLFSAIVHCLHSLVLPPAICCSSNIAKKAKKESFWNPAFQKAFYQAVLSIFCCLFRRIVITSGEWCLDTSFYHTGSHYGFLFSGVQLHFTVGLAKKKNRVTTIAWVNNLWTEKVKSTVENGLHTVPLAMRRVVSSYFRKYSQP